jgi:protein PhnA
MIFLRRLPLTRIVVKSQTNQDIFPTVVSKNMMLRILSVVTLNAAVAHSFTLQPPTFLPPSSASAVLPTSTQHWRLATFLPALDGEIPEPGPCPECSDENSYWDGSTLFVCTACGHEWPIEASTASGPEEDGGVTRDVNGAVLEQGDSVILIKNLGHKLKKGLKVNRIRLGDYSDGHDVEVNIPGLGTYALKSQFLKKV